MIRTMTLADIPEVVALGVSFHAQSGFDEIAYSEADCAASLTRFMETGMFAGLVADNGHIVGMIGGIISPVYFNYSHVSGEELFWYAAPDAPQMTGIKLLKAMECEVRERGCRSWQMKSLARLGGERMVQLYDRMGYRKAEHSFLKEL
jgi:hypothetical protein